MLFKVEFPYSSRNEIFENLDWDVFSSLWPLAQSEKPKDIWGVDSGPAELSNDQCVELMCLGLELKPVPYPSAMVVKMRDRKPWESGSPVTHEDLNNGSAVQVSIPDMGLLTIRTITVLEDCCTDKAQSWLEKGWRILAVCPPNAARRPDYILGHCNKDENRGR